MNILKFGYSPWKYPSNWFGNIKQFFRNIKFAYQRITRGYADPDIWDFDSYLSKIIINGSRHLADTTHGYPMMLLNNKTINSPEKWTEYLYEMASHFEKGMELEWNFDDFGKVDQEFSQGFNMLRESFYNLWD